MFMKKILLSIIVLCFCAMSNAQTYTVGTDVQKKNVLLEEYTGLNCGHCPEGHIVAKTLLNSMPGHAFAVNIHTGTFATPSSDEPDYRIAEGDSLGDYFKSEEAGYPSASVNRYDFDNEDFYLQGRSTWISSAETIRNQYAPVNLYVKSVYDGSNNTLTVHVEGYFTMKSQEADQRINVILTQDYIKGYQNGSSLSYDYIHMHMLRDFISPLWGDVIDSPAQGKYFSKDYTYVMPESINDVKLKQEDINVIAFVTVGKTDVQNVEGGKPEYVNYAEQMSGELSAPDIPIGVHYGYNYFEVKVKNNSSKQLTSAVFKVTVNDVTTEKTVECSVNPFELSQVIVPATYSFNEKGKAKYSITLIKMNDEAVTSDTLSGSFSKPIETNNTVQLKFTTDYKASQNRFMLKDGDGNIIKEYGPYEDGSSTAVDETINNLEEGKTYCFEITDSWGDGIFDGVSGSLITHTGAGKLIDQFYRISDFGTRSFFKSTTSDGIEDINKDNSNNHNIYTIDGRKVNNGSANLQKGIYIKDGKTVVIK
jgi:hypothetical protein